MVIPQPYFQFALLFPQLADHADEQDTDQYCELFEAYVA
jgi:hypothetical protein